jgi:hypothetical protein
MDRQLIKKQMLRIDRIAWMGGGLFGVWALAAILNAKLGSSGPSIVPWFIGILGYSVFLLCIWTSARTDAMKRRFRSRRFELAWIDCQDRLRRFDEVFRKFNKEQIGDLEIMPKTVRDVADTLYKALRRADVIAEEIGRTESDILHGPPLLVEPKDPQASALYRIADRNIQEYRQQYSAVMGGVERAEAQAAVFTTTLDTLRVKMLGYRLIGKTPEVPSYDFLEALAEARLQLDAIDKALDELDLSLLPKNVAVIDYAEQEEGHVGTNQT